MDLTKLSAPFPIDRIEWRVGSTNKDKTRGMALAYIDARDVMARLDDVCGPENWQSRYPHANGKTCCDIGIKIDGEWVWKSNGAGDTDFEGQKGAFSDAFKRAAVLWGIGRYLYDIQSPWVEIEQAGRSFRITDSEFPKLRAALTRQVTHTREDQRDIDSATERWTENKAEWLTSAHTLQELQARWEKLQAVPNWKKFVEQTPELHQRLVQAKAHLETRLQGQAA